MKVLRGLMSGEDVSFQGEFYRAMRLLAVRKFYNRTHSSENELSKVMMSNRDTRMAPGEGFEAKVQSLYKSAELMLRVGWD